MRKVNYLIAVLCLTYTFAYGAEDWQATFRTLNGVQL